jgi:leader peptidase (prepilin peptidase)/N-methyltransferase
MDWSFDGQAVTLAAASLIMGSFVGAMADRLPRGESVLWGRSKCRACGRTLGALDLAPIASFLLLHGRCRTCKNRIPREIFVVEWTALAVTISALAVLAPDLRLVGTLAVWMMFALAWLARAYIARRQ